MEARASNTAIRLAVSDDIADMVHVEVEAGTVFRSIDLDVIADAAPPAAEHLAAHIDADRAWVAELDGRVVGYAVASVVDSDGHLDQVSVVPEAAGRRLGSTLIDQTCAWARTHGFSAVTLTTYRDVAWNGPYYRRLGFSALADDELGPELAAIRAAERRQGLDVVPRVAMRRPLASDAASGSVAELWH